MNCDQAISHLTELARREPMESARQADCQAHLIACEECRERLAEIELLERTLRLVARAEKQQEASPEVERRLLAALRQERETVTAEKTLSRHTERGALRLLWRSAAALVLAAGLALVAWHLTERQTETTSTPNVAVASPTPPAPPATTTTVTVIPRSARSPLARPLRVTAPASPRQSSAAKDITTPAEADVETEEALTDYLFLNPGQRYYPLERGQLIRVTVPRSTLGSFGFPVNPERAMMPVKADLVVGEDGMARAIRFIK